MMARKPPPSAASFLMKGRLRETGTGIFNVDDTASDGIPASAISRGREDISFMRDASSEMTFGRRIALKLMKYKWYNPRAGMEDESPAIFYPNDSKLEIPSSRSTENELQRTNIGMPSLAKAWAYFEHVALDRYIVEDSPNKPQKALLHRIIRKFQKGDKQLSKAEPGEKRLKTRLYSPLFTPHAQLGDFGLGVGLYFSTLRAIALITFLLGLISIYNISYFASDSYMPQEFQDQISNIFIVGSAICTNTPWVPCPDCICASNDERGHLHGKLENNRCGSALSSSGDLLTFALKNDCDATPWQLGTVNYVTVILLFVATACLGEYLRRQEVAFDEDEQTAQDYSVRIRNPPPDATEPDEWRRFFEQSCDGAQVTVCTCAVDNDLLVRTLVERREILRTIENSLSPGESMSNLKLAYLAAKTERERSAIGRFLAYFIPGIPEWYARFVALNAKVQGLAQLDFPVTNVFLTFETEADQRRVLKKLSVGTLRAAKNDKYALSDPKYLFRGEHVLAIDEPDEPSTIRWQDLNAGAVQKLKEQILTAVATLAAIIAVAVIVRIANNSSPLGAAFAISAFNSAFPIFAKMLTELEAHAAEGEKQTSLYFKIAAFRWVNTAIVITIVTPFTDTLANDGGLIPQIYALFFAEIITVSAVQLADPMGHVNRHFFAPRATSQDSMNLHFSGSPYELAERYTDMTKLLFLCVWYCSIFPACFFLCSFSLFVKYFVDRFSLMRTWKRAPQLGTRVSQFSRRYFFSLACAAMAVICSFYWSGFPFDNLCESAEYDAAYEGTFTVSSLGDVSETKLVTVAMHDPQYRFCNQDLMSSGNGIKFPFVASQQPVGNEWMTHDQEVVSTVFGWSALVIAAVIALKFIWGWIELLQTFFSSDYSAIGDDQNIPFSQVASRNAYIPQVFSGLFSYPLIACDTDNIDAELYDWTDPDRPYAFYDLTKDAKSLLSTMEVSHNVGFSRVQCWPPKT